MRGIIRIDCLGQAINSSSQLFLNTCCYSDHCEQRQLYKINYQILEFPRPF